MIHIVRPTSPRSPTVRAGPCAIKTRSNRICDENLVSRRCARAVNGDDETSDVVRPLCGTVPLGDQPATFVSRQVAATARATGERQKKGDSPDTEIGVQGWGMLGCLCRELCFGCVSTSRVRAVRWWGRLRHRPSWQAMCRDKQYVFERGYREAAVITGDTVCHVSRGDSKNYDRVCSPKSKEWR